MLACSWPALAQGQEVVFKKVAVLPFTVVSKTPMEALGEKIRQEMEERFKTDGFTLIPQADLQRELSKIKEPLTDALAQEIGRKVGADVVILGQLIIVGEALALEAKILNLSGRGGPTAPIKLQGTGLKALPGLTRQLAQDVSLKILGKERISRIIVKGNRRIEKDAILGVMQTREGEIVSPSRLRDDIKAVYKMGYFTDVKVDLSDTPEGRVLTLLVQEKPAIKQIIVKGQHIIKKEKILEVTDLKPFMVASETSIKENINKIVNLYRDKGFYEAKVDYLFEPVSKTEVNLVLKIDEGGKLLVKEIDFTGNKSVKGKELKKVLETKEKSLISFVTGSGKLTKDVLERDLEKVAAYYFNHGFIKAKVGEPKIDIRGKYIYITIPVEEGPRYKVGKVDFTGELLEDKAKLNSLIELPKEKIYSREVVQKDLTSLSDFYADFGYANADVTPLVKENDQDLTVDVTFDLHKGRKVYFDRIEIAGNVRTRDKVIRRELRVYEQEMFSATKLKESIKNLRRLEYFEDVNFSTNPGSAPDRMNLKITVKERPTGTFGVGAGYSTQDRLVGMVEVSQNNLFGRGQQVKVQGILGAISHRFRASFTEPYLFDRPLSAGFDGFLWARDYSEYTRNSAGGDVRLSHPLRWQYTRIYGMYRFENVKLTNLAWNASPVLQEAARIHNTSSVSTSFRRDSRDATFNPTTGSDNSASVELAGLGGDTAFMRYIVESGWYFPLFWKTVGVLHGRVGYMQNLPWGAMPAYEKFYLGGIDSIRGFKYADISPRDPTTNDRIGGDKFLQLNVEYRFPLIKKLGVTGTLFFDAGNVYGTNQINPFLRTAVGAGFRWFSPMGPLRVEWGYNLAPRSWEKHSNWEFTVGSQF